MLDATRFTGDPAEFTRQHRYRMAANLLCGADVDTTVDSMWLGWTRVQRGYVPGGGGWHGFVFERDGAWGITLGRQREVRVWETGRPTTRYRHLIEDSYAAATLVDLLGWLDTVKAGSGWPAIRCLLAVDHTDGEAARLLAGLGGLGARASAWARGDAAPR